MFLLAGTLLITSNVKAQETNFAVNDLEMGIPAIALIATDASVILTLTTETPGAPISGGTGFSHVQISSIVATTLSRKITAAVTGIPVGTSLKVSTSLPTGGAGTFGAGSEDIDLINT